MPAWTDEQRKDFLTHLDKHPDADLNEWEAGFVGDMLKNKRPLSEKQAKKVDQMITTYRDKIKW